MEIQSLPELVIDILVEYLTEDDVLHCSMVSSSWREAFNNDRYWKIFCLRRHQHSLYDYLRDKPCQVEPVFKVPDECAMLPALCKWKVDYMRVRHLEQNIEHGHYRIFKTEHNSKQYGEHDYVVKGSNGDIICLYEANSRWCELWNICGKPFLKTKLKLALAEVGGLLSQCTLTMNQQILVILQGNVLQIFHSAALDFILKYRIILLDKGDEATCALLEEEKVCDIYFDNLEDETNDFSCGEVFGNVFLAIYMSGYLGITLCLWNLETGRKDNQIYFGEIPLPYSFGSDPTIDILHGSNTEIVVVVVRYYGEDYVEFCAIFKYNIESGEKMCISHIKNVLCVINEDLVIAKHNESLQFYDINTENPTLLKTIPDMVCGTYYVHEPYLMLSTSSHPSMNTIATITVIHTKTYEVLSTFDAEFKVPTQYQYEKFDLCNDYIMIIRCDLNLEVWNWKKQSKLYNLIVSKKYRYSPLRINAHFTHMYRPIMKHAPNFWYFVVGVCIYNFW